MHRTPHRGLIVTLIGIALMVMYIGDSAATSYGTVFMEDALDSTGGRIQAGLFAYLVLQLVGRILADRVIGRIGAARTLVMGALVGAGGLRRWSSSHHSGGSGSPGFALMGLGLSVVVPLTFSAADALDPAGTGTVIAKVNLFNYGGVIVGSAVIGSGGRAPSYANLRPAFAVPGGPRAAHHRARAGRSGWSTGAGRRPRGAGVRRRGAVRSAPAGAVSASSMVDRSALAAPTRRGPWRPCRADPAGSAAPPRG